MTSKRTGYNSSKTVSEVYGLIYLIVPPKRYGVVSVGAADINGTNRTVMVPLSPAEMLRHLAREETAKGIYRVEARVEGLPHKLDAASMRDLSLIVRESIGNAVKHGGAKKIAISSDAIQGGGWLLRIANDGAPFDPESAPGAKEGHFGLEGMRQRACRLGATVSFARRKTGMVVEICHPPAR